MQWIFAIGLSGIIYMILQSIDDHRCRQKRVPCATVSRKLVLFFFILIVVLVATFFMSGGSVENETVANMRRKVIGAGGGASGFTTDSFETPKGVNELTMLKNIREDIYVGSGPFMRTSSSD